MTARVIRRTTLVLSSIALVAGAAPAASMAATKSHRHPAHHSRSSITDPTNTDDDGCTAEDGGHAICFQ